MAPKLDKRTKEELIQEIGCLADSYTPEWRFQPERPDIGTALALLYADVMLKTVEEYNRVPERNRTAFFRALGTEKKEAERAEGYMTFRLSKGDMPEAVVPKGAGIAVDGKQEGLLRYETLQDCYVSSASVRWLKTEPSGFYLQFDSRPDKGLLSILVVIKHREQNGAGNIRWEYYGAKGWSPLKAEDGTESLSHSGILRFAGSPDFTETVIRQTSGYWIRGNREDGGEILTQAMEVYGNAAAVRARKPGTQGNLMPDKNHKLMQNVGYVTRIQNPDVLFGGCQEETMEQTMKRNAAEIRHQFRAVTPSDYEELVRATSGDVQKVKCFPGYDGRGRKRPGAVTVAVLQTGYMEKRHYFYRVQERIMACLREWSSGILLQEGGLFITQPEYVRINVRAQVWVEDYSYVLEAERESERCLEQFFDPEEGGHDRSGWQIGELPEYEQIKRCLLKQPHIVYVKRLWIIYEADEGGVFTEAEERDIRKLPWALPVSGSHQITVGVAGS